MQMDHSAPKSLSQRRCFRGSPLTDPRTGKRFSLPAVLEACEGNFKMDSPDLTIIHAEDGNEWMQYLDRCFHKLLPCGSSGRAIHIHKEKLEKLAIPLPPAKVDYVLKSKAQLVILTPDFLEHLQEHSGILIGKMIDSSRVVAMLCGVENADIEDIHRSELITYPSWQTMTVKDQDQEFVLQLFNKTVEIMNLTDGNSSSLKPKFKITPRKVKEGSNKVYILLHSALGRDQDLKVFIRDQNKVIQELKLKKKNMFTMQFIVPDNFLTSSQIISIEAVCDGVSLGIRQLKCETQMGELQHLLNCVDHPMAFICQTFGLTANMTKELDTLLSNTFSRNLPENFHCLDANKESICRKTVQEMPTLLHFAANYGLKELASLLLDSVGAQAACNTRNASGYCPADMAEISGFNDLAQMLENFTNLTVTRDLYTMISSVSDDLDSHKVCDSLYDYPRSIPLYDSPSSIPVPVSASPPEDDYLPMSSSTSCLAYLEPHKRLLLGYDPPGEAEEEHYNVPPKINVEQPVETVQCEHETRRSRFEGYTQSQVELLSMLEDFKRKKFSMNEVEELFEEWKLRQATTCSFKEKEQQLATMRARYEQIQQGAPAKGKTALSLDKIVNLLTNKKSYKKSAGKNKGVASKKMETSIIVDSNLRPVSTFSTTSINSSVSSSSSSDRMSTISSTSNYDSGTLSDSGDDTNRCNVPRKVNSISERITKLDIPKALPPIPQQHAHSPCSSQTTGSSRSLPPKLPFKPCISPKSIHRSEAFLDNEDRKPMPPPRPARTITPTVAKHSYAEETDGSKLSPDYVSADPSGIYQIPLSPPRCIYSDSGKIGSPIKKALMPQRFKESDSVQSSNSPSGRDKPDYMNLTAEEVKKSSREYTPTKHHDYYNWSSAAPNN